MEPYLHFMVIKLTDKLNFYCIYLVIRQPQILICTFRPMK